MKSWGQFVKHACGSVPTMVLCLATFRDVGAPLKSEKHGNFCVSKLSLWGKKWVGCVRSRQLARRSTSVAM